MDYTNLEDYLSAYTTHINRLEFVSKHLFTKVEEIKLLHVLVRNTLTLYGFDLQNQEFLDTHNKVFGDLMETVQDAGEVLIDLGQDVQNIVVAHQKSMDELREEVREKLEDYDKTKSRKPDRNRNP